MATVLYNSSVNQYNDSEVEYGGRRSIKRTKDVTTSLGASVDIVVRWDLSFLAEIILSTHQNRDIYGVVDVDIPLSTDKSWKIKKTISVVVLSLLATAAKNLLKKHIFNVSTSLFVVRTKLAKKLTEAQIFLTGNENRFARGLADALFALNSDIFRFLKTTKNVGVSLSSDISFRKIVLFITSFGLLAGKPKKDISKVINTALSTSLAGKPKKDIAKVINAVLSTSASLDIDSLTELVLSTSATLLAGKTKKEISKMLEASLAMAGSLDVDFSSKKTIDVSFAMSGLHRTFINKVLEASIGTTVTMDHDYPQKETYYVTALVSGDPNKFIRKQFGC